MKVITLRKPRNPRFVRRGLALVPAAAIGATLLGGCVTQPQAAFDASSVACTQVQHDIDNAQALLTNDLEPKLAVAKEKGTPDQATAQANVDATKGRIDALKARAASSACQSSTPLPTPTTSATPSSSPSVRCNNWAWSPDPHANFAWISGGLASIRDAKTDAEAAAAANDWMGRIQLDPVTLQGAIKLLLEKDVALGDLGNSTCASDAAKSYIVQMYLVLGKSRITPDQAPANGVNSGVANGTVYSSGQPTISGDRKAVRIDFVDATTGKVLRSVWIMARCGNGVTVIRIFVTNPQEICEEGPDKGKPVGDDGTCQKDASQDPQSRGQVPPQDTKTGPSGDNGTEVSQPATPPRDSGNGVPTGTPPRATPSPSPTHGGGPVVPPPAQPPAPPPPAQPTQTASVPPPPPPPA